MTNYEQFTHGHKGIFDVTLSDMFPIDSVELQCLSYVDTMLTEEFRNFTETVVLASNVDNLSEDILDLLAAQYRIPYYDSSFDIELKKNLVKEGYQWVMTAGTTGCVNRLIQAIFGSGNVVEWYEDRNIPEGYFDIKINDKNIPEDKALVFERILRNAKNVHSKLRDVVANHDMSHEVNIVSLITITDKIVIND